MSESNGKEPDQTRQFKTKAMKQKPKKYSLVC